MPRLPIVGAATLDELDDFFTIKPNTPQPSHHGDGATGAAQAASGYSLPTIMRPKNDLIRGRMIDEYGNPITPETFSINKRFTQPSYQIENDRHRDGRAYVQSFRDQNKKMDSLHSGMGNMTMDDAMTMEKLETHSMTGSTVSTSLGAMFNLPIHEAKVVYTGYRQGVYNDKLTITAHRQKIVSTIESTQCTIIQGMTGCGKTTQVPQYILDEYAKVGRRCKIAVTQPRRIAAISVAKRVCKERGWTEGTYCGYQVARDTKFDVEKTMITYMTTGILLQKLINERNLNSYTHVILDEVHERDQDTDLALLIVKKFIHTVSPRVKVILMSATFDCQIFADYFATEIRGEMQKAPVINVEGRGFTVQEIYWSDSQLTNLVSIPRFVELEPTVFPEAMTLVVKLMYEFDRLERDEQEKEIEEGKPVSRGTVLVFLPGLAEIQDLSAMLEKDEGLRRRKLTVLPLHSSITLEEQSRVFETPHVLYRKVILSTNIAESSITVPDIKYVIDFCLTKNLQTDKETNMTCLRMEWASKANCKQRRGRAGRVSNGRVYRLVHKAFYVNHLMEYGVPEMSRCPLTQLILRVKKLGPEEPRYILSTALDPPDMGEIGKAVLLLKEAGALADPEDLKRYNPFDGQMTFVGEVLSSLPLNIELGKLLVFGHMLGLLPECLIIAAAMHTRPIFQQPFKRRVEASAHRLRWDRGMHSDPMATVNAYKEWSKLREQEYFMRAQNAEAKWCRDNFLQRKTLSEVMEVIRDLTLRLEEHGIRPRASIRAPHLRQDREKDPVQENLLLKVTLACAFYPHYFSHQTQDEADAIRQLSGKSPLCTAIMKGFPNNQGILYKRQVEQMIHEHVPGCKVHASFENTKCYLEFEQAAGDCGRIPNALYTALRISQLKERLEIRLYDDQQSTEIMEKITGIQRDAALAEGRLNTNRMFQNTGRKPNVNSPRPQALPPAMMTCMELLVVHVEECGHFWGHEVDNVRLTQLHNLQEELNKPANVNKAAFMLNPVVGAMCVAVYEDSYFRARIDAIKGNMARVFFVDYGNTEEVNVKDIKQLLPEFKEMEFQAIECAFASIAPPRHSGHQTGNWPPAVNQMFYAMMIGKQLYCQIYSIDKDVLRLKKLVYHDAQHIDLHQVLHGKGMVSEAPESFTSQQNHRLRYAAPGGAVGGAGDGRESEWGFALDEDLAPLHKTHRRQAISGPFSPIEMKFHNLSSTGVMKEVRIEPSSVNSIALDEEPSDQHDRLMVAATVSASPYGNKVIARETTLMPNIHGLPSLICLLFAPSIQIRRDPQKRSYTGAICGLGRDPRTGGSAFPDHDMEIEFDAHIDLQDILKINGIRMCFNYCLGGHRLDDVAVARFQQYIRSGLKDLLSKSRPSKEKSFSFDRFQWIQFEEHDLLKHELEETEADQVHLFRLISVPVLEVDDCEMTSEMQERANRTEYLRNHCKILTKIASGSANKPLDVICELCSVRVSSTKELLVHIQSKTHRSHEFQLFGTLPV